MYMAFLFTIRAFEMKQLFVCYDRQVPNIKTDSIPHFFEIAKSFATLISDENVTGRKFGRHEKSPSEMSPNKRPTLEISL